jgi:hypothetical protein
MKKRFEGVDFRHVTRAEAGEVVERAAGAVARGGDGGHRVTTGDDLEEVRTRRDRDVPLADERAAGEALRLMRPLNATGGRGELVIDEDRHLVLAGHEPAHAVGDADEDVAADLVADGEDRDDLANRAARCGNRVRGIG